MISVEEPDDLIVLLKDYKHGDPRTNGLGHRKFKHHGKDAVIMPGERVWKVKRSRVKEVSINSVLDDGQEQVCEDQVEKKQQDMEHLIWGSRAVGVSIDTLFAASHEAYAAPTMPSMRPPPFGSGTAPGATCACLLGVSGDSKPRSGGCRT